MKTEGAIKNWQSRDTEWRQTNNTKIYNTDTKKMSNMDSTKLKNQGPVKVFRLFIQVEYKQKHLTNILENSQLCYLS